MSFLSPSSYQELRRPSSTMMTTPHLLLSVIPALLVPLLVYVYRRRGKRQKGRLPPGRQGFPVVGETLQLISAYKTENPEPFIDDRVRKHGRVFTTHLFGERTVFSADPVVNRQVMQGEGKQFQASYPSSVATLLGRHSLVVSQGSLHKRMHSLTLGAFANPTVLRDFLLPDIDSLVRLNLRKWVDGQVLSLLDHAKKITFELAVKQLMSHEPSEWTEALRRQYLMVIDGFFALPVPFFPFTTYGRALKARRKVAEALRPVVRQRKKELLLKKKYNSSSSSSSSNDNDNDHAREEEVDRDNKISSSTKKKKNSNKNRVGGGKDVLDALLEEEAENGSLEEKGEEEVVDFLLALLVAGYETTPTLITSLVKFLTESPAALAQVRDEHDAIRSMKKNRDDDPLDWNDYKSSMPFTQCVINETLRMANIISGVFRRATTDVHIKGYTIPKGCKVFASFRGVHLDPNYYEDARTFNPWRWQQQPIPIPPQQQQELSVATSGGGSIIFTPFGGGPRMCPGYELGRLEISVFLHYLVTSFSWEATMEDSVIHFPTTRTVKGYPIRVRRRLSPAA